MNFDYQASAALLLAIAVQEVLPRAKPLEAHISPVGFSYDFVFEGSLPDSFIMACHERVLELIRQDVSFESKSMMRENAIQLFTHLKKQLQAKRIAQSPHTIVEICQVDTLYDMMPSKTVSSSKEIRAVQITGYTQFSSYYPYAGWQKVLRVEGIAAESKTALKPLIKGYELAKKYNPTLLAKEEELIVEQDRPIWLPNGTTVRDLIIEKIQKSAKKRGYLTIQTPSVTKLPNKKIYQDPFFETAQTENPTVTFEDIQYGQGIPFFEHAELFENIYSSQPVTRFIEFRQKELFLHDADCDGLFLPKAIFGNVCTTFCKNQYLEEELISSLQFIEEISNLFSLKLRWSLAGARKNKLRERVQKILGQLGFAYEEESSASNFPGVLVECVVADVRGRPWRHAIAAIDEYESTKSLYRISHSLIYSFERLLALLLQNGEGNLPNWLLPVQVMVLQVSAKHREIAKTVLNTLQAANIRSGLDERDGSIANRMYDCHRKKVPYAIVVGDKEQQAEVCVRNLRTNEDLSLEEFIRRMENP